MKINYTNSAISDLSILPKEIQKRIVNNSIFVLKIKHRKDIYK